MEIEAQFDVFLACILFHPSGAYGILTTLTSLAPEHGAGTSSISAHIVVVSGVIRQCFVIIQPGNFVPINLFSVYSCLKFANRKGRINW